jgi:gliding motility-associated-like protein
MVKKYFCILFLIFPFANSLLAQMIISRPTFAFTQACANSGFNLFDVQINFSGSPTLDASNQFIVELSNPQGDFSSPVILYTSAAGEIKNSGAKVVVSLPTTTSGEKYQVRVRSTVPSAIGQNSNVFVAYYKPHDTQFTINNSVPNAMYCAGGSYLLSIDPNGSSVTGSPLVFSSLTYNWFKDNGVTLPRTLMASASTSSFAVTQPGIYYVETNYGTCTSNSYSNRVEVFASTTSAIASITSSKGNSFCPNQGATTLSTVEGNSYQWSKAGIAISGATLQTYQATEAGKYAVKVDFGGCQANASIELKEFIINSTIDAAATNAIEPGEKLLVIATTDATSPTYQWYLNNNAISGATSSTYEVAIKGDYKLIITQKGTCDINQELTFKVTYINTPNPFPDVSDIPNLISPNGDFINDTWILPQKYVDGTNTQILIISANGDIVLQTNNYLNDWPSRTLNFKNVNPVYYYIITTQDNTVLKGSITVIK